jgi:hypothetical protein
MSKAIVFFVKKISFNLERTELQGTYLLAISKKRVAETVGSFKGFINHGKANRAFLNKSLKN